MASTPNNVHEEELVARAQAGNADAFGDLYEMHLDAIYRYVYYRVGGKAQAEDLTETVFLKAWESLDSYERTNVPFIAWLYRIAHNAVVDYYRTRKSELPLETQFHLPDQRTGPEEQLRWNEEVETLTAAMARLKPVYQQVLILRFISGLDHAATAKIVGRSEGAVRVIQYRALKKLRRMLQEAE